MSGTPEQRKNFHDLQSRIWLSRFFIGVLTTAGLLYVEQREWASLCCLASVMLALGAYGHITWEVLCGKKGFDCGHPDHQIPEA